MRAYETKGACARIRILLLSASPTPYAGNLEDAGFEVVIGADLDSALEVCLRSSNPIQAALIIDDPPWGPAGQIARRLCESRPGLACVLLPSGVASQDCEIAIRTALRWTWTR